MDARAAKLAHARKKLKDHQIKKKQEIILISDHNFNIEHKNDMIIPEQNSSEIQSKNENNSSDRTDVIETEFLISSKRHLELQIMDLQTRNMELENNVVATSDKYETFCQKLYTMENELKNMTSNYNAAIDQLQMKDILLKELNDWKSLSLEEKSDLQEQLEFTKSILAAKETENDSLHSQLFNIQSQLDVSQLQLQQLTTGAPETSNEQSQDTLRQENEMLLHKVSSLEQQLKSQLKDYQQINSHYQHYVGVLNAQLKSLTQKNEELNRELQDLTNRENGLIEQISEMEIRIQNYNSKIYEKSASETDNSCSMQDFKKLQEEYERNLENFQQLCSKYEELQILLNDRNAKIEELSQPKEFECRSNEVSLVKLNADITSDKVAAQRATEQNKKLKHDLQGLEEAVVKMTKDKLELTEKITAEKYLNRELTIKLAEVDGKANNLYTTLKAKDEEMIRLQASYRNIEKVHEELKLKLNIKNNSEITNNSDIEITQEECQIEVNNEVRHYNNETNENRALIDCSNDSSSIPKGDAMLKLQERFLNIMREVADLSDEKHRLEHIIMQLQNETDTICEYVALYQQQRSLLKRRDEERSAQIKSFQSECNRLQNQLDELTDILKRFAEDKELTSYFQNQTKHEDIQKVMYLLSNLKTNSILDPHKSVEFNNFYPCSCCSGQLIQV